MAGLVPLRNISADMNCIAFKLILCFNSATSYTRKTLVAMLANFFMALFTVVFSYIFIHFCIIII